MRHFLFSVVVLLVGMSHSTTSDAQDQKSAANASFSWAPGKLIPNEFGLRNGTWSNRSIRQCMSMCAADNTCSGFSVEKKFGDAWQAGCGNGICDQPTECHAKGPRSSADFWLPTDQAIRVPAVNPTSNAWISEWGTILKKQN